MRSPDRLRLALGLLCIAAAALPFVSVRASRIAAPDLRTLAEVLTVPQVGLAAVAMLTVVAGLVLLRRPVIRAPLSLLAATGLLIALGKIAGGLAEATGPYARISPGPGAWLMLGLLALFFADAASRLGLGAGGRLALGTAITAGMLALLGSPALQALSLLVEYRNRAGSFWSEAGQHVMLAVTPFAAALAIGVPLGVVAARNRRFEGGLLGVLTAIQTVPSMAMFGLLIVPLSWVAANLAVAGGLGIRGIGATPAILALFLYSLLPVVGHTVAGLHHAPASTLEAAAAIGLNSRQRLWRVEIPLALPVILTGARIVLVQNIGLATVGALIGAGGFGVFVFQGIGQTATDLVLLGALPPVALAVMAALMMDALIACLPGVRR